MQATNRIRKIVTAVSVVLVAAVLIGAAAWQHPAREAVPTSPAVHVPVIGVPTGEYQSGVPVYRLPSIAVSVSRSEALARMAREDSLAMK
jgi:hypothetical protein